MSKLHLPSVSPDCTLCGRPRTECQVVGSKHYAKDVTCRVCLKVTLSLPAFVPPRDAIAHRTVQMKDVRVGDVLFVGDRWMDVTEVVTITGTVTGSMVRVRGTAQTEPALSLQLMLDSSSLVCVHVPADANDTLGKVLDRADWTSASILAHLIDAGKITLQDVIQVSCLDLTPSAPLAGRSKNGTDAVVAEFWAHHGLDC